MSFSPLKKLIKKRLQQRDLQQGVTESKVSEKTEEVLEEEFPDFFEQVEVSNVKEEKIILKARNSSVAQEIQLHQREIIEKVNEEVKQAEIDKIVFSN